MPSANDPIQIAPEKTPGRPKFSRSPAGGGPGHRPGPGGALKPTEVLMVVVASVATAVLSSMDQATRGPSISGWLLTNAPTLLNNAPSLFC